MRVSRADIQELPQSLTPSYRKEEGNSRVSCRSLGKGCGLIDRVDRQGYELTILLVQPFCIQIPGDLLHGVFSPRVKGCPQIAQQISVLIAS